MALQLLHLLLFSLAVAAQKTCSTELKSDIVKQPVIAKGFTFRLLTKSISKPRQMVFDKSGNLLVVESGKGITALTLKDEGGPCVSVGDQKLVVNDASVCL
jgi:hypothetical protein